MKTTWIRLVFWASAIYDALLAIAFLLFTGPIFAGYGIPLPNHPGYVQFPALLQLLFAVMFVRIAANPVKYRELMLYGIGLKTAYCGVIFWNWLTYSIPPMWLPWAWVDLVFAIGFGLAWLRTSDAEGAQLTEWQPRGSSGTPV